MLSLNNNSNNMDRGQFTGPIFFNRKLIFLLVALIILGCVALVYLDQQVLVVEPLSITGKRLIIPVENKQWYLTYTHSVQKTTVEEHFFIKPNNTFSLYRTRYSSFGVGLPFLPNEGHLTFLPNKTLQLDLKHPRQFPTVELWTGIEAKVQIITGSNTFPLYNNYPSGTMVKISTCKRYSLYC